MNYEEMNEAIAVNLMGYTKKFDEGFGLMGWQISDTSWASSFSPTSKLKDAWEVVEKIRTFGDFALYKDLDSDKWTAELFVSNGENYNGIEESVEMAISKLAINYLEKINNHSDTIQQ